MIQSSINHEYIIINKTAIQQRIEELESKIIPNPNFDGEIDSHNLLFIAKQNELNEVLSQSTPLIPEIEKAIQYGVKIESGNIRINYEKYSSAENQYISNLKLDI